MGREEGQVKGKEKKREKHPKRTARAKAESCFSRGRETEKGSTIEETQILFIGGPAPYLRGAIRRGKPMVSRSSAEWGK